MLMAADYDQSARVTMLNNTYCNKLFRRLHVAFSPSISEPPIARV